MSNTRVLMKIVLFIGLVTMALIAIAQDENFKEFQPHRDSWTDFNNQLEDNPLDRAEAFEGGDLGEPDLSENEGKFCLIQQWCPDLPTDPLVEATIDTGNAVLATARVLFEGLQIFFSFVVWGANTLWIFIGLVALILTFTMPGAPELVQFLFWALNGSMWIAVTYIGFRAIRGGG